MAVHEVLQREALIQPPSAEQVFMAATVLGGSLPPEAEHQLRAAGLAYANDALAEAHLASAAALAPDHPAVLIGRYRYFFYKGRWREALTVARDCLVWAALRLGVATNWRRVCRGEADFDSFDAVLPRFYLFTLKGYAYLHLRLGQLTEGQSAASKLIELDPADRLGGRVLVDVLARRERGDDDD
jgi:tetratricopeptide (TPR) repeat protein